MLIKVKMRRYTTAKATVEWTAWLRIGSDFSTAPMERKPDVFKAKRMKYRSKTKVQVPRLFSDSRLISSELER